VSEEADERGTHCVFVFIGLGHLGVFRDLGVVVQLFFFRRLHGGVWAVLGELCWAVLAVRGGD
jgi:hypothetical protein